MSRFTRLHVYQQMAQTGLVPLFTHHDLETTKRVLEISYRAGVRVFEYTNRGDYAHELFGELNKYAAAHFPDLILGAGTIVDAGTASLYLQLGANFIVTPLLKTDVAVVCNRRKIGWIPGCATLTEISQAEELGAEIVKLFPGNVLGPAFIKGLKGPMPWTSVMVTGGVEPEENNLRSWFEAGATCVGMGSQLFPKSLLDQQDYAAIEQKINSAIEIIGNVKK